MQDHYMTLGVGRTATTEEIQIAYKQKMKLYHPDLFPNDPGATKRAQAINAAKDTLLDSVARAKYDEDLDLFYTQNLLNPTEPLSPGVEPKNQSQASPAEDEPRIPGARRSNLYFIEAILGGTRRVLAWFFKKFWWVGVLFVGFMLIGFFGAGHNHVFLTMTAARQSAIKNLTLSSHIKNWPAKHRTIAVKVGLPKLYQGNPEIADDQVWVSRRAFIMTLTRAGFTVVSDNIPAYWTGLVTVDRVVLPGNKLLVYGTVDLEQKGRKVCFENIQMPQTPLGPMAAPQQAGIPIETLFGRIAGSFVVKNAVNDQRTFLERLLP